MKTTILFIFSLFFLSLFAQEKGASPISNTPISNTQSTYAVVVGISDYQDEGIPDLRFADKDAAAFAQWLQSPAGGAISSDHIVVLQNEKATNARIADALIWMLETCQEGDQAIIYFSGHGDVETITRFNRGYLLTYDSPPKIYMAGAFNIRDLQDIISTMSNNGVQVVMISDACRAGKLAGTEVGGTQATAQNLSQQFANEVKILSCQPNEFSLEGEQWGGGRGAFSYHLMDGLQGLADKNGDAQVNLFEIGRYLEDMVPTETAPHNQMPFTVGDRNTLLATVDEAVLAQLREQKTNDQPQLAQIETKGMEELVLANVDTSVQIMYEDFTAALDSKHLLEPAGESAYDLYQQLSQKEEIKDLHNIMRRNLSVALQEDAQQAVNAYLASNPVELQKRYDNEQDYGLFPRYLEKACELLGTNHFYYNNLMAKRYYFEGLGLRLQGEQAGWSSRDSFYQVAVQLQLKALEFQDKAPFVHNELGVLYTLLKMDDKAFGYLDQAIELAPNWGLPYVNYCVASYYTGDIEKAREMGEKAVERMPGYPQVYNFLGWIYADYSDFVKDKSNLMRRGVELKGQFFYDWDNMGSLSQRKERFQRTTELLKKATEVDPNYLDAHHNLGTVYANIGEYEAALPYLQKAIEIDSTDDYAWAMLGTVYGGVKEFSKGELAFKKSIELTIQDNPKRAALWCNSLGNLYGGWGKEASAIEQYKKAIELSKNYSLPRSNLSNRYLDQKDFEQAEYYALEYLRLASDYPASYRHVGRMYQLMNRPEDAEWMYLKALELNPTYVFASNQLLGLYMETKQYQKAQMVVQKALEVDPGNTTLLIGTEITYFFLGDQNSANKYAEKVDDLIKEDAAQFNEVALQYHIGKHYERAIHFLKKASELEPKTLGYPYNISCGYALMGDSENALKWLSKSLALGYQNFEHIYQDSDLESIWDEPAFKELMRQYFPGRVYEHPAAPDESTTSSEPLYFGENCVLLAMFFEHTEKDYERAEDFFDKAIALDPFNESVAVMYLGFCSTRGQHKKALQVVPNFLDSQNDSIQSLIAITYYNNQEFEKAENHFEKAYSLAPDNYLWVSLIGGFYMTHLDSALAEKYLRRAIAIETDMSFASGRLATLYYAMGRKQQAHRLLDSLINNGQNGLVEDYMLKAFLHLQSGENDLAKEVLTLTKLKWAPCGQILDFLELTEKQDYEGATAAYQAFLKRFEWSFGRTYFDYLYCEMLVRQGELTQAMEFFEFIIEQSFGPMTLSYPIFNDDPDLAPLREMDEYQELMQRYFPEKTNR